MEVSGQLHVQAALLPWKESPKPVRQESGWVLEPVWTRWQREKIPCWSCRESNPSSPIVSLVTILTELTRTVISELIYMHASAHTPTHTLTHMDRHRHLQLSLYEANKRVSVSKASYFQASEY